MKQFSLTICVLLLVGMLVTVSVYSTDIDATVTPQNISLSVLDTSIAYGSVALGAQKSTLDTGDNPDVVNTGNVAENFLVKGWDTTGTGQLWILDSSTSTQDHYINEWSVTGAFPGTALTVSNVTATSGVPVNSTSTLDLRIGTPGSSTDYNLKNIKVTVTAEAN
ncbi:hypothetical protein A2108_02815 [Candidatus Wolfebacteria bacterium GWA1_42_9]|uniref:WxL domain-containing protein n=1 Tax=Candidatus Wolfebacteria bacterium GWA1_42_9 TaxID=1802553 RepID=A0A1F8DMI3_9BACT|nr:MAG: hypothetical protein UW08_C0002G0014 [Parcubacteria group bacterium GW2011_GWB1_43_8b]OGM89833.1 MAG: hypothetical protein A2108_02815 [Candidatus Wolfebacteria bacterium GWA1_42_9]